MRIREILKRTPLHGGTFFGRFWLHKGMLLLLLLIVTDLVFFGFHSSKSLGYLSDPNFSVTKNFGYAESFQYLKAGFLGISVFILARKFSAPLLYCWASAFTYILLDDSLEVHEFLGYHLGAFLENKFPALNLGNTEGELIVFGFFGLLIFLPMFWYYFKAEKREIKIATQDLFILFAVLIFFGVGIDLIHDLATPGTIINGLLGLAEDGGEMIIMSVMVWYLWAFSEEGNLLTKSGILPNNHEARPLKSSAQTKYTDREALSKPGRSNFPGRKEKDRKI